MGNPSLAKSRLKDLTNKPNRESVGRSGKVNGVEHRVFSTECYFLEPSLVEGHVLGNSL